MLIRVELKNKENFMDDNGNYISDIWFDHFTDFHNGFAGVRLNDKFNFINERGEIVFDEWFDWAEITKFVYIEGYRTVKLNGKYNWVDENCKLVSDVWFDDYFDDDDGDYVWDDNNDEYIKVTEKQRHLITEYNGETYLITNELKLFKMV